MALKRILSFFKKEQEEEVLSESDVGLGLEDYSDAQKVLDNMHTIYRRTINPYDPKIISDHFKSDSDFDEHGRIWFRIRRDKIVRVNYLDSVSKMIPSITYLESTSGVESDWGEDFSISNLYESLNIKADELDEDSRKIINSIYKDGYYLGGKRTTKGAKIKSYDLYTARLDEYEKAFNTDRRVFLEDKFKPTIIELKTSSETLLMVIVRKYADTIHKISVNMDKSVEVNGKVTETIIEKTVEILRFFIDEIEQAKERIEELRLLEIEKINETMVADLDDEIKFVKDSLVQKHDWGIVK